MHIQDPEVLSQLRLSRFSATGDGMHVELARLGDASPLGPMITFREDEELGLQVLLHGHKRDVVLPLSELQRAIELAVAEVHKESFYD